MYLGFDIGTSSVTAMLIGADGSPAEQARAPLAVGRPQPQWSEQHPCDWWAAVEAAVMALDPRKRAAVQGIGLAGQMLGATLLGPDDRPLRAAILWNDGRSSAECSALEVAEPRSHAITGNPVMPGFTAPKLMWVARHEPEVFARLRTVLLPKDYVRLCMTGDKASDVSDSAGTLWLDCAVRDWSDVMLAATGLSREQMPALYEGSQPTGQLRADIAARWGMKPVPVAAGGGDTAAGAAGIGLIDEGDALLSLGAPGMIFVATREFRPNPGNAVHALCHCLPDMWHQLSVHLSAARCIDWAAALAGMDVPAFFAAAQAAGAGAGPELFLPYLSGEGMPHGETGGQGALLGLSSDTGPGRLASAILEGVAFSCAGGLDALRAAGTQVDCMTVVGSGTGSRYWGTILAAALGVRLDYLDPGEASLALGAARLACMAVTGASAAEVCRRPQVIHTIDPDPALAAALASKRDRFRAAEPAILSI